VSKHLEVYVEVEELNGDLVERCIEVTDFNYSPGRKACLFRAPEDCYPAEPAEINDIECHWQDTGADLSDENWDAFGDQIEEACFEHAENEAEAAEDDAADQAYERMKDREMEARA
jgi:hypothetical protein